MFKKNLFLVLVFLILTLPLMAQEDNNIIKKEAPVDQPKDKADNKDGDDAAKSTDGEADSEEEEEREETLIEKTRRIDIQTASYYELAAWCDSLGLPSTGTKASLQARLSKHYKIRARQNAGKEEDKKGEETSVTIEAARKSEYFKIEEVDEEYIRLSGGVVLVLEEKKDKIKHSIFADEILFNVKRNEIMAIGNIEYVKTQGTKDSDKETFKGQQLLVDLDNWVGAFYQGVTERQVQREVPELKNLDLREAELSEGKFNKSDVKFYFTGKVIRTSGKDITILEDGRISSSEDEDPYYQIKAKKIWILGPKEWGLVGATFYIGRIPLIFLPFFYQSQDRLFFRPVIGTFSDFGHFLQTTTYFLGDIDRKKEDSSSMFDFGINSGSGSKKVYEGIYLRSTSESGGIQAKTATDYHLKLMADFYSDVGVYLGLDGSFKNLSIPLPSLPKKSDAPSPSSTPANPATAAQGPKGGNISQGNPGIPSQRTNVRKAKKTFTISSLDFNFGLGFSYMRKDELPYLDWIDSYVFGKRLPFRFGTDLALSTKLFSINFEYLSDPNFSKNFYTRKEDQELLTYALLKEEVFDESSFTSTSTNSLNWNYKNLKSFSLPIQKIPFISSFTFKPDNLTMTWARKINSKVSNSEYPDYYFFYPDIYSLKNNNLLNVRGTIFDLNKTINQIKNKRVRKPNLQSNSDLSPPWEDLFQEEAEKKDDEQEEVDLGAMELPALQANEALKKGPAIPSFNFKLDYALRGDFNMNIYPKDSKWNSPEDIDYDIDYYYFDAKLNNVYLKATGNTPYNYLMVSDTLKYYLFKQEYLEPGDKVSAEDKAVIDEKLENGEALTTEEQAMKTRIDTTETRLRYEGDNSKMELNNNLVLTLKPFVQIPFLSASYARYELDMDLFSYEAKKDENDKIMVDYLRNRALYESDWFKWDEDHVKKHSFNSILKLTPSILPFLQNASTTFQVLKLPPLNTVILPEWAANLSLGDTYWYISPNFKFDINAEREAIEIASEEDPDLEPVDGEWKFQKFTITPALNFNKKVGSSNLFTGSIATKFDYQEKTEDVDPDIEEFEWVKGNFTQNFTYYFFSWMYLRESFIYDVEQKRTNSLDFLFSISKTPVTFNFNFDMQDSKTYSFSSTPNSSGQYWTASEEPELSPQRITSNFIFRTPRALTFWKNRISALPNLTLSWSQDLQRFTNSSLTFGFNFNFSIAEFLDLEFSLKSANKQMYQYIPALLNQIPVASRPAQRNFFSDLAKSFNLFNKEHLKESPFNLDSISIKAVHYMKDWNLYFVFSGKPESDEQGGRAVYKFKPKFGVYLRWIPIGLLKSEIHQDIEENLTIR